MRMHSYERDWQRLPLEGTVNTRELGGYPTVGGAAAGVARWLGVSARPDSVHFSF